MALNGYAAAQDIVDINLGVSQLALAMGMRVNDNEAAIAAVNAAIISLPADLEEINNGLAAKLNITSYTEDMLAVTSALGSKLPTATYTADMIVVNASIATKLAAATYNTDQAAVNASIAAKLAISTYNTDQTAVNTAIGLRVLASTLSASSGATAVNTVRPETGGATRSVAVALNDLPVSVEAFLAAGESIATDAGPALTKAVTAANGRTIELLAGRSYNVATWTVFSNTSPLVIRGFNATLTGPASPTVFLSPGSDFDIQDTVFTGWQSIVDRTVAQTGTIERMVFSRNVVIGGLVAISLERPINRYWIEDNRIEATTGGYAIRIGTNTYSLQDTWQRGTISNNKFKDITASGTSSCAAMLIYGRYVKIEGNDIDGVTQTGSGGGGEAWGIYTKLRHSKIINNSVRGVTSTNHADVVGINIKGAPRALTSSGVQGYNILCLGNQVNNIGVLGSKGTGIRAQCDDVTVALNSTEDAGAAAYVTDDTNGYSNHKFDNNRAWFSTAAGCAGIKIAGTGKNVTVVNNIIKNAAAGLTVGPGASPGLSDVRVTDNIFECTSVGIELSAFYDVLYLRMARNTFIGMTYAFLDNGNAGATTGIEFEDNDVARATVKISGPQAGRRIRNNRGFMTGSATYDPPSIAAGARASTSVSCPGALLGDKVMASFSVNLASIVLLAWVSTDNTVAVDFVNNTAGTIDLASGTISVEALR